MSCECEGERECYVCGTDELRDDKKHMLLPDISELSPLEDEQDLEYYSTLQ